MIESNNTALLSCDMKNSSIHLNDPFVSVHPDAPKKKRNKKIHNVEQILDFGTPGVNTVTGQTPARTTRESLLDSPFLISNWTPSPVFRAWDPSSQRAVKLNTTTTHHSPLSESESSILETPTDLLGGSILFSGDDSLFLDDDLSPIQMDDASLPMLLEPTSSAKENVPTLPAPTGKMFTYKTIHSTASPRGSWKDCKQNILTMLESAHRTPLDFLLDLLDPEQDGYEIYRSHWFSRSSHKIALLLDRIFAHPKGHNFILDWMRSHALDSVCSVVSSEMDQVVKELSLPSVQHLTPDMISNWKLETTLSPATQHCPTLLRILETAAQTEDAKQKNKTKNPETVGHSSLSFASDHSNATGLSYYHFPACISALEPMPEVSRCIWPLSMEHWVLKKNDRHTFPLQSLNIL
jgi:hypothetical protein